MRQFGPEDFVTIFCLFPRWSADMKAKVIESRVDKTQLLNHAVCQASQPPKVFIALSAIGKSWLSEPLQ